MGTTYELTGNLRDVIPGGVSSVHAAYIETNVPDGEALVDTTSDGGIAPSNVGRIAMAGDSFTLELLGTNNTGLNVTPGTLRYRVHVEHGKPGLKGLFHWHSAWFELTADANLKTVVGELELVAPSTVADLLQAQISGYEEHGDVSGAVTFHGPTASHRFDATGPTTITLSDYAEGQVATLICFSGADDVTVNDAGDVALADGTAWTAELARGVWVSGGGGGTPAEPDATPPSAVTDLVATGGSEQIVLTWSAATDAESTVSYGYKVWLVGNTEPGTYTTRTTPGVTVTGLAAGNYNVKVYSYSSGGSTTPDTATATVTAPPGPLDDLPMVGHWDASTLSGTAGTEISTWDDLTGTADMAQLTPSKRPTVQPATLNGMAVARFGTDDYLDSAARATSSHTLVLLRKISDTSGTTVHLWHGSPNTGSNSGSGSIVFGGNRAVFVHGIGIPSDGPAVADAWERWIIRTGPGVATLHVNGTQVVTETMTMTSVPSNGLARLGASFTDNSTSLPQYNSGGMDVAEAMIFDAVLTTGEVADVDAYLVDKWGL